MVKIIILIGIATGFLVCFSLARAASMADRAMEQLKQSNLLRGEED